MPNPSNTNYNPKVTDAGGYVYQYLFYSPFGESLYSQHAQTGEYNTPHQFNAKELDPEPTEGSSRTPLKIKENSEHTGNYYYGARYYTCPERLSRFGDPRVSVWLRAESPERLSRFGMDPLAGKFHSLTPYHFVANNPVMIFDPDGRDTIFCDNNVRNLFLKAYSKVVTKNDNLNKKFDKALSKVQTNGELDPTKFTDRREKRIAKIAEKNSAWKTMRDDFETILDPKTPQIDYYSADNSPFSIDGVDGGITTKEGSQILAVTIRTDSWRNRRNIQATIVHENRHVNQTFSGKNYGWSSEIDAYSVQQKFYPNSLGNHFIETRANTISEMVETLYPNLLNKKSLLTR